MTASSASPDSYLKMRQRAISMFANLLQFGYLFGTRRDNGRGGWLGVLVAFVLARVFATGTRLREDAEGLV